MTFALPQLLIGVALLLFGRRLYWLFVGAAGFLLGAALAERILPGSSQTVMLVIALGLGVVGVLLALFIRRMALGVAGFILGGLILLSLASSLGLAGSLPDWLFFLAGGIIGAILMGFLFNWALILLSAVAGAALVVNSLVIDPGISLLVFVVLAIAGILVQARQLPRG